ncbi:MAG: DUF99 family protein [Candidatus Bathyarchaeota archaeon]
MRPHYTVAGVEDGSFEAFRRGLADAGQYTLLCLTVMRGAVIQDVQLRRILVDGLDATDALLNMLSGLEVNAIILGGVTFGGFNVADVEQIHRATDTPIIVFSMECPDMEATLGALSKHFSDWCERWRRYEALGPLHSLRMGDWPEVFYEAVGCSTELAEKVIRDQAYTSRTPEALRVANMVAKGLSSVVQGPGVCAGGS